MTIPAATELPTAFNDSRYRVRKSWADSKTQKGAYKILDNAKKCADRNPGHKVFDADGKAVYEPKAAEPAVKVPFLVKVSRG